MISRRIIRIKAFQILYAYYSTQDNSLNKAEKELFLSIQQTYDLYHHLLTLVIEIADYAEKRIEIRRHKLLPTQEELNPNIRFIKNKLIEKLRYNTKLNSYIHKSKLNWENTPDLVEELYKELIQTDFYNEYMANENQSFIDDKKFVEKIFTKLILLSEDVDSVLEEESIYWNDDVEFVISMITKTLKKINEHSSDELSLMPMFKDEEDRQFAKDLFRKSILNHDEIRGMIDVHSRNWDIERIAFADIIMMQLGLTEFIYFPSIPTKVTLNEYIEISKFYSTDKSRNFINGILDKALKELKEKGKIQKAGRGLIGES